LRVPDARESKREEGREREELTRGTESFFSTEQKFLRESEK
jgi:hypothetical protein